MENSIITIAVNTDEKQTKRKKYTARFTITLKTNSEPCIIEFSLNEEYPRVYYCRSVLKQVSADDKRFICLRHSAGNAQCVKSSTTCPGGGRNHAVILLYFFPTFPSISVIVP